MGDVPTGRADQDFWWSLGALVVGSAAAVLFRRRTRGLAHLPTTGGGILASNHVSVLDPIFLGLTATDRGRTVRFLAAAETFDLRVIGWGLRRLRQIPIVRGARDVAALEGAARVVRSGALAGIYPEGGVVGIDEIRAGRRGAARLALTSASPLIPVGIWGTNARWPKSGPTLGRPWRPTVAVCIGAPILSEGDPRSDGDLRALTDGLMDAIAEQRALARTIARHP